MKILIVDDSKVMRRIVRRAVLGTPGYAGATLVEAENGREGLAAVAADAPDVILSDWNMPEMDGLEFLQALDAAGDCPPFGFVTSESTLEMQEVATEAGASFFVSKPFTPTMLAAALDSVL